MSRKKKESDDRQPKLTINDLIGKQSVRATFRLPQQVIELLSVIAGQLGVKQKSLFDQLVENASILEQVAQEAKNYSTADDDRVQKTFVISRSSLLLLNNISQKQQISRDMLVEAYIKQLLPVIDTEIDKHKTRKVVLKEMMEYLHQGEKLLEKAEQLLGRDDFVYDIIQNQVNLSRKNVSAVNSIVKKGMPMENW